MKTKTNIIGALLCCVSAILSVGHAQAATTLFSLGDVKLDGTAGENTYIVKNGADAKLELAGSNLKWTSAKDNNSFSYVLSYFTAKELQVGDSLTLSYTIEAPNSSFAGGSNSLRLGLFDSNSKGHISTDLANNGNTIFAYNNGFGVGYQPGAAANGKYGTRQGESQVLFGGWGAYGGTTPTLTNPTYTSIVGTFTVTHTSTGVTLSSSIGGVDGGTLDLLTSQALYTNTFDTLGFFSQHGGAGTSDYIFTNLTLIYQAVPEPSTLVLLGIGGLLIVSARALRSKKSA